MVKINPPVTIVDLPPRQCRTQHQPFDFKLLKIYNHRPRLCLFWGFRAECSVTLLYSKFKISEGLQLFLDNIVVLPGLLAPSLIYPGLAVTDSALSPFSNVL